MYNYFIKFLVFMERMLNAATQFCKESDWTNIAHLKLAVGSLGILVGMGITPKNKKLLIPLSIIVFIVSYAISMCKFGKILKEQFIADTTRL